MNKIKEFLRDIWGWVILVGGIVIAVLTFFVNKKNEEIEALKTKISIAKTQKDADLLEVQIKEKLNRLVDSDKEKQELQKTLDLLEQKRHSLKDDRTEQEKLEYWNK